jgi:imidazole glycerol-phosphate synthase subunit HisF
MRARTRVIPCLLLHGAGLVKTVGFRNPTYVGDPINAIKIFNDKEVDELVLLDIDASRERRGPRFDVIRDIASECFMPLGYGGGVRTVEEMRRVLATGVEKVIVNTAAAEDPSLVEAAAREFGSQSVVVSLDARRKLVGGYEVRTVGGTRGTGLHPVEAARRMEASGAGEILLTSVDRDGTQKGYDLALTRMVADAVSVPVVACGGAGSVADMAAAVREGHASAVAAGSMFVFHGRHRAVLISYLSPAELRDVRA